MRRSSTTTTSSGTQGISITVTPRVGWIAILWLGSCCLVHGFAGTRSTTTNSWGLFEKKPRSASTSSSLYSTPKTSATRPNTPTAKVDDDDDDDDNSAVLTDLDARVLQSMLQDDRLDLRGDEQKFQKLLERGVKAKEPAYRQPQPQDDDNESEFSSQVLKTLGDTKLWKAVQRNAKDWLESASIYVTNKVERDAQLLASLGIFAFERAMQDVGRALPAAATKMVVPKVFQLSETSSYDDNKKKSTRDIRKAMATPLDEIQSVQRDLQEILATGGRRPNSESSNSNTTPKTKLSTDGRGLRSVSTTSKTSKERLQKAYQRQQVTTLQREQENIVGKSVRWTSKVVDSAYQVQREIQIEPNQPGYKTKRLRQGAVEASKLLASVSKELLGGAKAVLLSEGNDNGDNRMLDGSDTVAEVSMDTSAAATVDPDIVTPASQAPVNSRIPWTSTSTTATTMDAPPPPPETSTAFQPTSAVQEQRQELRNLLATEVEGLWMRIQECLQQPEETWLQPGLVDPQESNAQEDQQVVQDIVTLLVLTEKTLETVDASTFSFDSLWDTLKQSKRQVDQIVSTAQLVSSTKDNDNNNNNTWKRRNNQDPNEPATVAEYLQRQLIYGRDHQEEILGLPVLLKLELLQREWKLLEQRERLEALQRGSSTTSTSSTTTAPTFTSVVVEEAESTPMSTTTGNTKVQTEESSSQEFYFSPEAQAESVSTEPLVEPRNAGSGPTTTTMDYSTTTTNEDDDDSVVVTTTMPMNVQMESVVDTQPERVTKDAWIPEIVEVNVDSTSATASFEFGTAAAQTVGSKDEDGDFRQVMAEIVADDEFDQAVGETAQGGVDMGGAKQVDLLDEQDMEDETKEPNPAVQAALRSLDVAFLVFEKAVMVAPTVLDGASVATTRLSQVSSNGLGSKGWDVIESAQRGDRRY